MSTTAHAPNTVSNLPDPWLTVSGCADEADCHPATIRRMIRAGRLRYARIGQKDIRIRRSWLTAAMESGALPIEETT